MSRSRQTSVNVRRELDGHRLNDGAGEAHDIEQALAQNGHETCILVDPQFRAWEVPREDGTERMLGVTVRDDSHAWHVQQTIILRPKAYDACEPWPYGYWGEAGVRGMSNCEARVPHNCS